MQEKAERKLKYLKTPRQALQRLKVLSHKKRFDYLVSLCRLANKTSSNKVEDQFLANFLRCSVLEIKDIKRYVS